jgi:hypothetical protein
MERRLISSRNKSQNKHRCEKQLMIMALAGA